MSQMWKPFHSSAIVKDLVAEAGFEPAPFPVLSGATLPVGLLSLERDIGHDPIPTGWKPVVLPLHQSRVEQVSGIKPEPKRWRRFVLSLHHVCMVRVSRVELELRRPKRRVRP